MSSNFLKRCALVITVGVVSLMCRLSFSAGLVGNIDDSYQAERVTISLDGKLYAWDSKGNTISNWPIDLSGEQRTFILNPRLLDLDGDSRFEILAISRELDDSLRLHVYNGLGDELSKWSKNLNVTSNLISTPIVADINQDNKLEAIFSTDDNVIHIIKDDGNSFDNVSVPNLSSTIVMSMLDLENCGKPKLFGASNDTIYRWELNSENDELIYDVFYVFPNDSKIIGKLFAFDINNDGYNELIVSTAENKINIIDKNGNLTQSIPIESGLSIISQPVIGDIDLDGSPDISVLLSNGTVAVYRKDGALINSNIRELEYREDGNHAVGKIVDDLYNGIFSSSSGLDLFTVYMSSLNSFGLLQFGKNIHEYDRNAEYHYSAVIGISDLSVRPLVFTPNGDGKNDFTEIHYNLSKSAYVTIELFNSNNQFISELIKDKSVESGSRFETWDGVDRKGTLTDKDDQALDSGIYILKITAKSKEGTISSEKTQAVLYGIKARIEFPANDAPVWNNIAIKGVASDPNIGENKSGFDFESYKLYYREGTWNPVVEDMANVGESGSPWVPVSVPLRLQSPVNLRNEANDANYPDSNVGVSPVQHGHLGTFETSEIANGEYTILLKVVDGDGNGNDYFSYDYVHVNVANQQSSNNPDDDPDDNGNGDPDDNPEIDENTGSPIIENVNPVTNEITEHIRNAKINYTLKNKPSDINVTISHNNRVVYTESFLNSASERTYEFNWNGLDNLGRKLENGVYNVLLSAVAIDGIGDDRDNSAVINININDELSEFLQIVQFASSMTEFNPLENTQNLPERSTAISYLLNKSANVSIEIFDESGVLVNRLLTNKYSKTSGNDFVIWDGTDFDGLILSFGNYVCRLTAIGTEVGRDEIVTQSVNISLSAPNNNNDILAVIDKLIGDKKSNAETNREKGILLNNDDFSDDFPLEGNPDFYWYASGTGTLDLDIDYNIKGNGTEQYSYVVPVETTRTVQLAEIQCIPGDPLYKSICAPVSEINGFIQLQDLCLNKGMGCVPQFHYDAVAFTLTQAQSQYEIKIDIYDVAGYKRHSFYSSDSNPRLGVGESYAFPYCPSCSSLRYTFKRRPPESHEVCVGKSIPPSCHTVTEPVDPNDVLVNVVFTLTEHETRYDTRSWNAETGWVSNNLTTSETQNVGAYPESLIGTHSADVIFITSQNYTYEVREKLNNSYRHADFGACANGRKQLPFLDVWMGTSSGPDTSNCTSHNINIYADITENGFSTIKDTTLANGKIENVFPNFNEDEYKIKSDEIIIYDAYESKNNHPDFYTFSNIVRINNWDIELKYPNGDMVSAFEVVDKALHGNSALDLDENGIPEVNDNIRDSFRLKLKPDSVPKRFVEIRGYVESTDYELKYYNSNKMLWIDIPTQLSTVHEDETHTLGWWDVTQLNGENYTVLLRVKNNEDEVNEDTINVSIGKEVISGATTIVSDAFGRTKLHFNEHTLEGETELVTVTPVPTDDPTFPSLNLPSGTIPVGPVYNLQPDGISIDPAHPVQMEISYTCEEVWNAFGSNPAEITVYNLKDNGDLELISTVNSPADTCDTPDPNKFFTITAMLEHFSNYIMLKEAINIPDILLTSPLRDTVYNSPLHIAGSVSGSELEYLKISYRENNCVSERVYIYEGTSNGIDFEWDTNLPSGKYILKIEALNVDGYDNSLEIPINLDTDAPLTKIMVDGEVVPEGQSKFVSEESVVSFMANDKDVDVVSGTTKIEYKIDAESFIEYVAPFNLSGRSIGNHIITFVSYDSAGNRESDRKVTLILREDDIPQNSENIATQAVINGIVYESNNELWTNNSSLIEVKPVNASNLLAFTKYAISSAEFVRYLKPISLIGYKEGIYQLEYYGTDIYERDENVNIFKFIIDAIAPEAKLMLDGHYQNNSDSILINSETKIILIANDVGEFKSGIKQIEYKFEDDDWETYEEPFAIPNKQSLNLAYRSIDNVDNMEDVKIATFEIDEETPSLGLVSADTAISPNSDGIKDEMEMVIDLSDQFSKILFYTFKINNQIVYEHVSVETGRQSVLWNGKIENNILANGNYVYILFVEDEAGNRSVTIEGNIVIDTVSPEIRIINENSFISSANGISLTYNLEDNLANAGILVDIDIVGNSEDSLAIVKSTVDLPPNEKIVEWNGKNIANNILPDGIYYIKISAKDPAGNSSCVVEEILSFDGTAPTTYVEFVGGNKSDWISSDTKISLIAVDHFSGMSNTFYRFGAEGSSSPYNVPFSIAESGTREVAYWSVDNAGNVEDEKRITLSVDNISPVSNLSWNGINNEIDGTIHVSGTATNLILSAEDEHSGLDKIWYQLDAGGAQTWLSPFSLRDLGDGLHRLVYWSVDNVGNKENINNISIYLHGHPPNIDLIYGEPKYQTDSVLYITSNTPVQSIAKSDAPDITRVEYRIGSKNIISFAPNSMKDFITPEFKLESEGNNNIWSKASDDYENFNEISKSLIVDNSAPITRINQSQKVLGEINFVSPSTGFTLDPQDNYSGVKETQYRLDNGEWINYSSAFKLITVSDGEHSIEYWSKDNLDNVERVNKQKVEIISIDAYLTQSKAPRILVYYLSSLQQDLLDDLSNDNDIDAPLLLLVEMFESKLWRYEIVKTVDVFLKNLRSDEFDIVLFATDQNEYEIAGSDQNNKIFRELTERVHNGLSLINISPADVIKGVPWHNMWNQFETSLTETSDYLYIEYKKFGRGKIAQFVENPLEQMNILDLEEQTASKNDITEFLSNMKGVDETYSPYEVYALDVVLNSKEYPVNVGVNGELSFGAKLIKALGANSSINWVVDMSADQNIHLQYLVQLPARKTSVEFLIDTLTTWDSGLTYSLRLNHTLEMDGGWETSWEESIHLMEEILADEELPDGAYCLVSEYIDRFDDLNINKSQSNENYEEKISLILDTIWNFSAIQGTPKFEKLRFALGSALEGLAIMTLNPENLPVLSANAVDTDEDGLSDDIETSAGLDPYDKDSDDDGVVDGLERGALIDSDGDGLINALDSDSDDDGILDGIEMGVINPVEDPDDFGPLKATDNTQNNFIADLDSSTTTDPTKADSDDGGLIDSEEDKNINGLFEPELGETDPNNPLDDSNPSSVTGGGGGCAINFVDSNSSSVILIQIILALFIIGIWREKRKGLR